MTIKQLYYISDIFSKYRHDPNFTSIGAPTELKFKKYFKKIDPLPNLSMILGPCFKIYGTFSFFG